VLEWQTDSFVLVYPPLRACSWTCLNLNSTGLVWEPIGAYASSDMIWSSMSITHLPTELALRWLFQFHVRVDGQQSILSEVSVTVNRPPVAVITSPQSDELAITLPATSIDLSAAGSIDDVSGGVVAASWQGKIHVKLGCRGVKTVVCPILYVV
jgi:hypothetical protein